MSSVLDLCMAERTLVVFDEVQNILDDRDCAASMLQYLVDMIRSDTDSMFVICGSPVPFMRDQVLNRHRPLYGRFPFLVELGPLSVSETRAFHPSLSDADLLRLYLVLGGVPEHHRRIGDMPYAEVPGRMVTGGDPWFAESIEGNLSAELGSVSDDAFRILDSVSSGHDTRRAMMEDTGMGDRRLTRCLEALTGIGVLRRYGSVPEARRYRRYAVSDRAVSFHFSVVRRCRSMVPGESRGAVSRYLSRGFEAYCSDLVMHSYPCERIGSWWGSVPKRDDDGVLLHDGEGRVIAEGVCTDVTATIRIGRNRIHLFGDCGYASGVTGMGALRELQCKVGLLKGDYNTRFALFSMSGFDEDLEEYAEEGGVLLFGPGVLTGSEEVPDPS